MSYVILPKVTSVVDQGPSNAAVAESAQNGPQINRIPGPKGDPGPKGADGTPGVDGSPRNFRNRSSLLTSREVVEVFGASLSDQSGTERTRVDLKRVLSSEYATLAEADAAALAAGVPLVIDGDLDQGSSPVSLSSPVNLVSARGRFTGTGVVTFNGEVFAPSSRQCFANFIPVFGTGKIPFLTFEMFGAVGNNSTICTTAINNCLSACSDGSVVKMMPRGKYLIDAALTCTKTITLEGAGWGESSGSALVVKSTVPNTTDILTFVAPSGGRAGLHLSGFRIFAQSGTPGRDALVFDCTGSSTSAWSDVTVERLGLRSYNGRGLYVNNNALDHDAFFLARIRHCSIQGGIYLNGAGDSISVVDNTLNTAGSATSGGQGPGIEARILQAFDPANNGDAKLLRIESNNITATGGAVIIRSGTQIKIVNNNIEMPNLTTATNKALIDIQGDSNHVISGCEIRGNFLGATTHKVNDCVRVDYAKGVVIYQNTLVASGGYDSGGGPDTDWIGVRFTANSSFCRVGGDNVLTGFNASVGTHLFQIVGSGHTFDQANSTEGLTIGTTGNLTPSPVYQYIKNYKLRFSASFAYTINAPESCPYFSGTRMEFMICNVSGGAMTAPTWDAVYKLSGAVLPSNGKMITVTFEAQYNSGVRNWFEVGRTAEVDTV